MGGLRWAGHALVESTAFADPLEPRVQMREVLLEGISALEDPLGLDGPDDVGFAELLTGGSGGAPADQGGT